MERAPTAFAKRIASSIVLPRPRAKASPALNESPRGDGVDDRDRKSREVPQPGGFDQICSAFSRLQHHVSHAAFQEDPGRLTDAVFGGGIDAGEDGGLRLVRRKVGNEGKAVRPAAASPERGPGRQVCRARLRSLPPAMFAASGISN